MSETKEYSLREAKNDLYNEYNRINYLYKFIVETFIYMLLGISTAILFFLATLLPQGFNYPTDKITNLITDSTPHATIILFFSTALLFVFLAVCSSTNRKRDKSFFIAKILTNKLAAMTHGFFGIVIGFYLITSVYWWLIAKSPEKILSLAPSTIVLFLLVILPYWLIRIIENSKDTTIKIKKIYLSLIVFIPFVVLSLYLYSSESSVNKTILLSDETYQKLVTISENSNKSIPSIMDEEINQIVQKYHNAIN